ncbi:MAG: hypothetical protein ACHQ51_09545 [Elusimicrobiota bacterium]
MRLTERDYKVLEALEKWGALGLGQVDGAFFRRPEDPEERMRLMFNEIGRSDYWRGAYKRMDALRKLGLVTLQRYVNHHQTYLLTAAGHALIRAKGRALLGGRRPTLPETFVDHELAVAGVGLILEETLGRKIISHRQLYASRDHNRRRRVESLIPDLWIADQERPCAVEVELCQKSELRYRLWGEYRDRLPTGGRVLYLTGWPRLKQTLLNLAADMRYPDLYAASLQEFRAARERCVFTSATEETFQIAAADPSPAAL